MTLALTMYEQQLVKLETPVEFSKIPVHVPSYHELYPSIMAFHTAHRLVFDLIFDLFIG